jgi:YLP motif-containing protein 1
MKYEYDKVMDETYQKSLLKSFKKVVDDGLFDFIIVDMINNKLNKLEEMSDYAKLKSFQIYIIELNNGDSNVYFNRNVHNRSLEDIKHIINEWEPLPTYYNKLDPSIFVQTQEIEYVNI